VLEICNFLSLALLTHDADVLGKLICWVVLQNYEPEDVLGLSSEQIVTVVRYMLSEARGTSLLEDAVRLIGQRMDVLRACCRGNPSLISTVIDFLVEQLAQKQ